MVRFRSLAELRPAGGAVDAELSDDEVFDLRGDHVFYLDGDGEDAWRAHFPYLRWLGCASLVATASACSPGSWRASCCRSCGWYHLTLTILD